MCLCAFLGMLVTETAPARGAEPSGRVMPFDLGVSLALPEGWLVLQEPSAASPSLREPVLLLLAKPADPAFAPGPPWASDAMITLSRSPNLPNGMVGAETEAARRMLTQEGYRVAETKSWVQLEGVVEASYARFYCYSKTTPPLIVEIARWRSNGEMLVAQLRYSEALRGDLRRQVDDLKKSVLRNAQQTLAFGTGIRAAPSPSVDNPAPATMPGATPAASLPPVDFAQAFAGDLVVFEGEGRSSLGFIATLDRQKVLIADPRAVLDHNVSQLTFLDHSRVAVGAARIAVASDLLALALSGTASRPCPEVMKAVDQEAAIGDEVVVLCASPVTRIVKPVAGTIAAISPSLVELDGPITRADDGSPVIHKRTGEVIGISRAITEIIPPQPGAGDRPTRRQTRCAMRLDAVKTWQALSFPQFYAEDTLMAKVRLLTRDLEAARFQMEHEGVLRTDTFKTPEVQSPVQDFVTLTNRGRISTFDMLMAKKELLAILRKACTPDIQPARQKLGYDYFLRALQDQESSRQSLEKFFAAQLDFDLTRFGFSQENRRVARNRAEPMRQWESAACCLSASAFMWFP